MEHLFHVLEGHPRDRAIFGLMVGAGLRVGEVASRHLGDLETPAQPGEMTRLRVLGKGRQERIVWITPEWYGALQDWRTERPAAARDHCFLNHRGEPLSVAGIQNRLEQHGKAAQVSLTCHQRRHTFARRLAEGDIPVESLARLLGHRQVETTQRYIAGANREVWAAFAEATVRWEARATTQAAPPPDFPAPPVHLARPDPADRTRCQQVFADLPEWVQEPLGADWTRRWRNWPGHLAYPLGQRLAHRLRQVWAWWIAERGVSGGSALPRCDLEAWLSHRQAAGIAPSTQGTELADQKLLGHLHLSPGLRGTCPERRALDNPEEVGGRATWGEMRIMAATAKARVTFVELKPWERDFVEERAEAADWEVRSFEAPAGQLPEAEKSGLEVLSCFIRSDVDAAWLDQCPHLKLIATRSTGYDHIDLAECQARSVTVCNVSAYGENTVAEHTFGLILALSRNLYPAVDRMKRGDVSIEGLCGFDLYGKTL